MIILELLRNRFVWFLIILVAALQFVGSMDAEDLVKINPERCERMQLWQDTDGAYGWPIDHKWFRSNCRGYGAPAGGD